jgi:hypothetical protein
MAKVMQRQQEFDVEHLDSASIVAWDSGQQKYVRFETAGFLVERM